jgi:hypothetical protein
VAPEIPRVQEPGRLPHGRRRGRQRVRRAHGEAHGLPSAASAATGAPGARAVAPITSGSHVGASAVLTCRRACAPPRAHPHPAAPLPSLIRPPAPLAPADVIGFAPSQKDVELFNAIGKAPDAAKFPNVARYYSHIASFSADAKAKWAAGFGGAAAAAAPAKAAAAPAKAAEEEEDVDLFGDDADAAAAKVSAAAPKVEEKPKKKEKVPEISKTSCMYEVKPQEAGQDMAKLEKDIRAIAIDGVV